MTTSSVPSILSVDLTVEQAQAVVDELVALWSHANHDGKRKVKMLHVLRETLTRELAALQDEREAQS